MKQSDCTKPSTGFSASTQNVSADQRMISVCVEGWGRNLLPDPRAKLQKRLEKKAKQPLYQKKRNMVGKEQ